MKFRDEVSLGRLKELLRYEPESGDFIWLLQRRGQHPPGSIAGGAGSKGYWCIRIDGVRYLAHRLAWLYMTGDWPKEEIDHKDTNRLNNKWNNLREASHTQNMINVKARSKKNRLKGAYPFGFKGLWYSKIRVNKTTIILGVFNTEKEAHEAYVLAAKKYHGEFARAA